MSIKEQITKLPDGVELPGITDGTFGLSLPTTDLKALADNHTRLLALVKDMAEKAEVNGYCEPWQQHKLDTFYKQMTVAIEEAEKI